jgi:hypothetical protein
MAMLLVLRSELSLSQLLVELGLCAPCLMFDRDEEMKNCNKRARRLPTCILFIFSTNQLPRCLTRVACLSVLDHFSQYLGLPAGFGPSCIGIRLGLDSR